MNLWEHIKNFFSSHAVKAWIAGLSVVIGGYLIPVISQWLGSLTPETVTKWFEANWGVSLDYGIAATVIGLAGAVWTYIVRNRPPTPPDLPSS